MAANDAKIKNKQQDKLSSKVVFAQKNTPRPEIKHGGLFDIDVNDAGLVKALNAVKGSFGKKLNSSSVFEVSKVNSARAQMVAGINYEVNLTLTQKDCYAKGFGDKSSASCTSKNLLCQAFIWAKLDATYKLRSMDCNILILLFLVSVVFAQKNTPRPNLDNGGFHDIDVNDPDLLKALNAVKDSFGKKLNSTSTFEVSKVNSARSQIVAGINYEVKLTLTQKTCYHLGLGFNSGPSCTSEDRLCQATIWAKVDATYELTSIDCK
ncbi:kininogen 1 [Tyrophagus putrescentiae]|nr:kininogen 1 [Tyrophagus putrescentiae]